MSDAAGSEIGITIRATDRTAGGLASASKGAEALEKKFNGIGNVVKKLPGQFAQLSGAMMIVGSSMGDVGGKVTMAIGKFSSLAAMVATGGPLGVGMAAISAAFMIYAALVDDAAVKVKKLEEAEKKRADELAKASDSFWKEKEALNKQEDKWRADQKKREDEMAAGIAKAISLEQFRDATLAKLAAENLKKQQDIEAAAEEVRQAAAERRHEDFIRKGEERLARSDAELAAEMARAEQAAEHEQALRQQVASTAINAASAVTAAYISGSQKEKDAALEAALVTITSTLVKAASEAIAAHAGIPWIGPVIGAAFAAIMTGMIMSQKSKLHAASGGLFTGGVPGRDSIDARVMPGELIMPPAVASAFMGLASGRGQSMIDNSVSSRGGDTNVSVSVGIQALDVESVSESQLDRVARKLGRKIEGLRSRGFVPKQA